MSQEKSIFNLDSSPENGESPKLEKEIAWEEKEKEVSKITDSIGRGVDEKIKNTVVAFLIQEFTTSGSCEGHITEEGKEQHGLPYPWIEIYASEPKGWEEAKGEKKKQLDKEWSVENFKQQQRMMKFLEEFYQERETPFDARLVFSKIGAFGGFRVQSFGAEITVVCTPEERKKKLELYRKEIEDFSNFLKSKYFSKE